MTSVSGQLTKLNNIIQEFTAEVATTGSEPAKPDPVPDESSEA